MNKALTIVGLGYVGYPLALQAASKGNKVFGFDINCETVDKVNSCKSPVTEDEHIKSNINKVKIHASDSIKDVQSNNYIICVPTPVKNKTVPDLKHVISAVEMLNDILKDGDLVVIESTINPGVCEEIVLPILQKSGKKIMLAHCPERINPGDKRWNVSNIPRVLGGINPESTKAAKALYASILDGNIIELNHIKAVEATKILENTFRDINIAFINEMAQSFQKLGININEVIKGASSKPFAFMPHYPGAGVGGHCIAVDPYYMIEKAKEVNFDHQFLSLARKINSGMPAYTVSLLQDGLNEIGKSINGSRILILGVAYKPDVNDYRESPSFEIIDLVKKKGAVIDVFDPVCTSGNTIDSLTDVIYDGIILVTAHTFFLEDTQLIRKSKVFIDGRNAFIDNKYDKNDVVYKGIGVN